MCKCNPSIRTPFCGKPGCEEPIQTKQAFPTIQAKQVILSIPDVLMASDLVIARVDSGTILVKAHPTVIDRVVGDIISKTK